MAEIDAVWRHIVVEKRNFTARRLSPTWIEKLVKTSYTPHNEHAQVRYIGRSLNLCSGPGFRTYDDGATV